MCKAQMSMKSDSLLCHRRSGVTCLCDLRQRKRELLDSVVSYDLL